MLDILSRWLVQQPAHIALIAAANLALWMLCRVTVLRKAPRSNVFWVAALLWLVYAGWEWLVLLRTPEADIRVDLLLIWPIVGLVQLWAVVRAAKGWRMSGAGPPLLGLALVCVAQPLLATADGPDFFRVVGVARASSLNLRAEPSAHAMRIARIPSDGQCLRNLGCQGGLTFEEYSTLPEPERKRRAEANPRWCRVEYEGLVGWVAGKHLAEGECPAAQRSGAR